MVLQSIGMEQLGIAVVATAATAAAAPSAAATLAAALRTAQLWSAAGRRSSAGPRWEQTTVWTTTVEQAAVGWTSLGRSTAFRRVTFA